MRKLFGCCDCSDNAEVSSEISWTAGQTNKGYVPNQASTPSAVPVIVITQPAGCDDSNTGQVAVDNIVEVDIGKGSSFEADRFSDMSETIFKRIS